MKSIGCSISPNFIGQKKMLYFSFNIGQYIFAIQKEMFAFFMYLHKLFI